MIINAKHHMVRTRRVLLRLLQSPSLDYQQTHHTSLTLLVWLRHRPETTQSIILYHHAVHIILVVIIKLLHCESKHNFYDYVIFMSDVCKRNTLVISMYSVY